MRAITAAEAAPSAMAGRIRCFKPPLPPAGTSQIHRKHEHQQQAQPENGMEMPKRAPTMLRLSKMEYCRVAEMTPAMRPMNAAIK